jgi:hypothetical protein
MGTFVGTHEIKNPVAMLATGFVFGGEGGIRTLARVSTSTDLAGACYFL